MKFKLIWHCGRGCPCSQSLLMHDSLIRVVFCVRCPGYPMISAEIPLKLCFPALSPLPILVCSLSCVRLFATPWTVACQDPLSWDFPGRNTGWVAISSSRASSWPRERIHISCLFCIGRWILYHCVTWQALPILGQDQKAFESGMSWFVFSSWKSNCMTRYKLGKIYSTHSLK